jgi:hypothetical protein
MSHYATLNEYRFEEDVDDIRGAKLYGEGVQQLGRIRDVVFDHATGDIRYLVVDYGHDRRVLLPLDQVFRTVTDEHSFSSELTPEDLDHLPAFDDRVLKNDRQWRDYENLHRSSMEERRQLKQRFVHDWKDDPVQHQDDVAYDVTPAPGESGGNVTSIDRDRDEYVPDIWPERIAPVFGSTRNDSDKLHMTPKSERFREVDEEVEGLGPRWNDFTERMKRDLHKIRGECQRCSEADTRAA